MTALQNNNKQILCNLLPAHVAAHFIDNQNKSHMVIISFKGTMSIPNNHFLLVTNEKKKVLIT